MSSIKQTIEDTIYTYDQNEFQPVWRDGELDNKAEFALYKASQFAEQLGHLASRTLTVATTAGAVLLEHIAQDVE